jgi:hypothetical protein
MYVMVGIIVAVMVINLDTAADVWSVVILDYTYHSHISFVSMLMAHKKF